MPFSEEQRKRMISELPIGSKLKVMYGYVLGYRYDECTKMADTGGRLLIVQWGSGRCSYEPYNILTTDTIDAAEKVFDELNKD